MTDVVTYIGFYNKETDIDPEAERNITYHNDRPSLGEAVMLNRSRYIVIDTTWDYDKNPVQCYLSALRQEIDGDEVFLTLKEVTKSYSALPTP